MIVRTTPTWKPTLHFTEMMNHFTFNDNVGPNFTVSLAVKHYLHAPPRRRRVAAVSVEQQQAAAKATFRECTMPRLFLKCGTSTGGAPEAADAVGAQPPGVRRGIQHVEGEAAGTRARPRAAPRPVRVRAAVRCRGAGGGGEGEAGTPAAVARHALPAGRAGGIRRQLRAAVEEDQEVAPAGGATIRQEGALEGLRTV